jgi:hypothetical protein
VKRLLVLVLLLVPCSAAFAATTSTYSGTASPSSSFDVYFSTVRVGALTVSATFNRKANSNVWLRFGAGDPPDPGFMSRTTQPYWCEKISDSGSGKVTLTCSWASVPADSYHAQVESWKGPTAATVTVAAETQ